MSLLEETPDLALTSDERRELEQYRSAFEVLAGVTRKAALGDLEARVPMLDGDQRFVEVRTAVNHLLDLTDAFVREAAGSLAAASESRFHRAFLPAGMSGAFRDGAVVVDRARLSMAASRAELLESERHQAKLADDFESAVLSASEHVAAASTQLGATARYLSGSAGAAVDEVTRAATTITSLDESSTQIGQVVVLIRQVAAQSRLLALNATIEAARAGEAGRGFAVVATEVKHLAEQTGLATEQIENEVEAVHAAALGSRAVLEGIATTVREMHEQVLAITDAVEGAAGVSDMTGLSQLAEMLRAEVTSFLGELRS